MHTVHFLIQFVVSLCGRFIPNLIATSNKWNVCNNWNRRATTIINCRIKKQKIKQVFIECRESVIFFYLQSGEMMNLTMGNHTVRDFFFPPGVKTPCWSDCVDGPMDPLTLSSVATPG